MGLSRLLVGIQWLALRLIGVGRLGHEGVFFFVLFFHLGSAWPAVVSRKFQGFGCCGRSSTSHFRKSGCPQDMHTPRVRHSGCAASARKVEKTSCVAIHAKNRKYTVPFGSFLFAHGAFPGGSVRGLFGSVRFAVLRGSLVASLRGCSASWGWTQLPAELATDGSGECLSALCEVKCSVKHPPPSSHSPATHHAPPATHLSLQPPSSPTVAGGVGGWRAGG